MIRCSGSVPKRFESVIRSSGSVPKHSASVIRPSRFMLKCFGSVSKNYASCSLGGTSRANYLERSGCSVLLEQD